MTYDDDGVN